MDVPSSDEILWRLLPSNAATLAALEAGNKANSTTENFHEALLGAPDASAHGHTSCSGANTLSCNSSSERTAEYKPPSYSHTTHARVLKNEASLPEMHSLLSQIGTSASEFSNRFDVIHVAGSKGKGTVAAFAESVCRAHGRETLLFTSPHLVHARERIRINGRSLAAQAFDSVVRHVYSRISGASRPLPGFFRFLTLAFFEVARSFAVERCSSGPRPVAVVEVGMGGRYDATNVIGMPRATVVTALDLEHVVVLGPTLADIARHKAGIAKPGVPLFHVPDQSDRDAVVRKECESVGAAYTPVSTAAELQRYGISFNSKAGKQGVERILETERIHGNARGARDDVQGIQQHVVDATNDGDTEIVATINNCTLGSSDAQSSACTNAESDARADVAQASSISRMVDCGTLASAHNARNAALALAACRAVLGASMCDRAAAQAIRAARWPGRQHMLVQGATAWYLDGAHTAGSAELAASWFAQTCDATRDRVLVFYCAPDKDEAGMMWKLLRLRLSRVLVVTPSAPKRPELDAAAHAVSLAELWCDLSNSTMASYVGTVEDAVAALGGARANVLVCGSLYVVGDALRALGADVDNLQATERERTLQLEDSSH